MDRVVTDNRRVDIFCEINLERIRQDRVHPWGGLNVMMRYKPLEYYTETAMALKEANDFDEEHGEAFIDQLIDEEFHETFAETDPAKQRIEAVQLAALCVRLIEEIDRKMKDNA